MTPTVADKKKMILKNNMKLNRIVLKKDNPNYVFFFLCLFVGKPMGALDSPY